MEKLDEAHQATAALLSAAVALAAGQDAGLCKAGYVIGQPPAASLPHVAINWSRDTTLVETPYEYYQATTGLAKHRL